MNPPGYHHHARTGIEPLLPERATRILDVGCGAGLTAAWLRARYPGSHVTGLEGNPDLADELAGNVDTAHIVDLDGKLPDIGAPDLVLCLDVLEHLRAPERVLAELTARMPADGTLIVSLPNVAHLSVALPLLLRGRFPYADAGILDRTHLRFYDHVSAPALLASAGFTVRRGIRSGLAYPRARWLHRASLGLLRNQLTRQFIMAGQRGAAPGPIDWIAA